MPIKGLTDITPKMPRLGKIRTGIKAVSERSGKEYPKAVDYFVVPEEVQKKLGEKPRAINIRFPLDSTEVVAPAYYKAYGRSTGLVCKGDGETANRLVDMDTRKIDKDTGEILAHGEIARSGAKATGHFDIPCPGEQCPYYQSKECRQVMTLQFLIPEVSGLGVWQFDTSSYHSIRNIYGELALVRSMFGTIAMIPLVLTLEPQEVAPEGKKKTVYVVHVRSRSSLMEIAEQQGMPLALDVVPMPAETQADEMLFPDEGFEPDAPELPESFPSLGDLLNYGYNHHSLNRTDMNTAFGTISVSDIPFSDPDAKQILDEYANAKRIAE